MDEELEKINVAVGTVISINDYITLQRYSKHRGISLKDGLRLIIEEKFRTL